MRYPRLSATLMSLFLLVSLSACADPTALPSETETTATDLRAHYDALVIALRDELADLRTDTYVTTETLLARIEALEAALESLGVDVPTGTHPPETESSRPDTAPPTPESTTEPLPTSTETTPLPETDAESTPPDEAPPTPAIDFSYTIADGEVTITGLCGDPIRAPAHLTIPDTLEDCPVTRIADNAFSGLSVETVILPATLSHIGWFAFAGCGELRVVTIPASVMRIDYGAFDACPRVTLYCPRDSYAARYAAAAAIPFVEA